MTEPNEATEQNADPLAELGKQIQEQDAAYQESEQEASEQAEQEASELTAQLDPDFKPGDELDQELGQAPEPESNEEAAQEAKGQLPPMGPDEAPGDEWREFGQMQGFTDEQLDAMGPEGTRAAANVLMQQRMMASMQAQGEGIAASQDGHQPPAQHQTTQQPVPPAGPTPDGQPPPDEIQVEPLKLELDDDDFEVTESVRGAFRKIEEHLNKGVASGDQQLHKRIEHLEAELKAERQFRHQQQVQEFLGHIDRMITDSLSNSSPDTQKKYGYGTDTGKLNPQSPEYQQRVRFGMAVVETMKMANQMGKPISEDQAARHVLFLTGDYDPVARNNAKLNEQLQKRSRQLLTPRNTNTGGSGRNMPKTPAELDQEAFESWRASNG